MIHIVRVLMDGRTNFIVSDDDKEARRLAKRFKAQGASIMDHKVTDKNELGFVIVVQKEGIVPADISGA